MRPNAVQTWSRSGWTRWHCYGSYWVAIAVQQDLEYIHGLVARVYVMK